MTEGRTDGQTDWLLQQSVLRTRCKNCTTWLREAGPVICNSLQSPANCFNFAS